MTMKVGKAIAIHLPNYRLPKTLLLASGISWTVYAETYAWNSIEEKKVNLGYTYLLR